MTYLGESFEYKLEREYPFRYARITHDSIVLGWHEGGADGHLEATSSDGAFFQGHYGFPRSEESMHVEFTLFRADSGEVILLGPWWNTRSGNEGQWLFRLRPSNTKED